MLRIARSIGDKCYPEKMHMDVFVYGKVSLTFSPRPMYGVEVNFLMTHPLLLITKLFHFCSSGIRGLKLF